MSHRTWRDTSEEKLTGAWRWLTTVDHEDIGKLYLCFAAVAFAWGGLDAIMMRMELLTPAVTIWGTKTYDGLFTLHGITMLFLFATPAIFGFANYLVPHLVGADDMAFPRINAVAFWMLPPALILTRMGLVSDALGHLVALGGAAGLAHVMYAIAPAGLGWTLYTPLSTQLANPDVTFILLGLHLSGISTTMGAINFLATIIAERDKSLVPWGKLDIFSWTILVQAGLILFAFPILGAGLIMILLDRNFGLTFFNPHGGGGPLLWQHLFWFFGHPEVYILVLPAMGAVSLILPKFAGRKLFGFKFIVYSTIAIGVMSFGVWAHHMFTTGIDPRLATSFMAVSLAIAVPSAVKVFNWITTIWNGKLRLTVPMLFCLGGVSAFIIGGVTGVFLAAIPYDFMMQDTYYVVGHFHLIIVGFIVFGLLAALYYYFPMITGKWYNRRLGRINFWLMFVGVWVTFVPMLFLGIGGLPRRMAAYPAKFETLQWVSSFGTLILTVGGLVLVYNLVQSLRHGEPAGDDPWDLEEHGVLTLEWRDKMTDRETPSDAD